MLKRNDLVTKIFLALYLVSTYVEYMYMCVHMCIMNMHVSVGGCVFSCFTSYLGLTMTTSFCLYIIIRFNKAY